jgi:hypothetical protein
MIQLLLKFDKTEEWIPVKLYYDPSGSEVFIIASIESEISYLSSSLILPYFHLADVL